MSLQKEIPTLAEWAATASQQGATTAPSEGTEQRNAIEKALSEEFVKLSRISQLLSDRKFNQLSATEAITAASTSGSSSYTVFDLGDGETLKAWVEKHDPTAIYATVYGRDGKILHEYKPIDLPMKEIDSSAR